MDPLLDGQLVFHKFKLYLINKKAETKQQLDFSDSLPNLVKKILPFVKRYDIIRHGQ